MDNDKIHDLVVRLARPGHQGGHVIERAAIMAAGADSAAVEAWILAHAGTPEQIQPTIAPTGLHGDRYAKAAPPARRFLLPQGALTDDQHAGPPAADKEFTSAAEKPRDRIDPHNQATSERD
jgi:hypothetical protein